MERSASQNLLDHGGCLISALHYSIISLITRVITRVARLTSIYKCIYLRKYIYLHLSQRWYTRWYSGSDKSRKRKWDRHYLARVCVCAIVPAIVRAICTNIVNIRNEIRVENHENERRLSPWQITEMDFSISVLRLFSLLFRKSRVSFSIHHYPLFRYNRKSPI